MGTTALGDLPSGGIAGPIVSHASVASDGGAASYGNIGAGNWRTPQAVRIDSAYWEPTGADQGASSTASYRALQLIDAGVDGLGTRVLASKNLQATIASNTLAAMTLITDPSVAAGHVVAFFSGPTVGGANATHTVLRAGQVHVNYRPI
jgi:hypothetical protein